MTTGRRPNITAPPATKGRPTAPPSLKGEARAHWTRVIRELETLGYLSTGDRTVIALLCKSWARWVEAEAKVDELGIMVAAPKTKTPMSNPYLAIANKAHEQILRLSAELGLTVLSRT